MKSNDDYLNESIPCTPNPRASSTLNRISNYKVMSTKRVQLDLPDSSLAESSVSSLGLLHASDMEITDHSESGARLKTQRNLAQSTMDRVNKKLGNKATMGDSNKDSRDSHHVNKNVELPSIYLQQKTMLQDSTKDFVKDFSTVNDSDLLTRKDSFNSQKFYPANVSTPRSSEGHNTPNDKEISMFENITAMSEQLRNSDINIQDICSQLQYRTSLGKSVPSEQVSHSESQSFIPAELMGDKFKKDELSWRKQRDIPCDKMRDSAISSIDGEKPSMGHFFQTRKNDLGDFFKAKSPERAHPPVALVDTSNISVDYPRESGRTVDNKTFKKPQSNQNQDESSILSISTIQRVISDANSTHELVEELLNRGKPSSTVGSTRSRSKSPRLKENDCDEYMARMSLPQSSVESVSQSNLRYSSSISSSVTSEKKHHRDNVSECGSVATRCPSSLDSIPDGKLPIKGNKLEIIWGCTKVGRHQTKSFSIKNQLNQKIRLQVSVSGRGFQLVKEKNETDLLSSMIFILHPFETKTLSIMFSPKQTGPFHEKLMFCPFNNGILAKHLKQTIHLFGYGGHISIDITKIIRDPNKNFWLTLGTLDRKLIQQTFSITNVGILSAFAMLEFVNARLIPEVNELQIKPSKVIIKPNQEIKITLTYIPTKEDFKSQQDLINIGFIRIIYGAEVVRGRIRKLRDLLISKKEKIDANVDKLSVEINNEDIPRDIALLREGITSLPDLLQEVSFKDVRLNIEKKHNSTLQSSDTYLEDTMMFHTLYQDTTVIQKENDSNKSNKLFTITPNEILFSLPFKKEDTIFIQSKNSSNTTFKACVSEGFTINPSSGVVSSNNPIPIQVSCIKVPRDGKGKVSVHIKDEILEVNINFLFIK